MTYEELLAEARAAADARITQLREILNAELNEEKRRALQKIAETARARSQNALQHYGSSLQRIEQMQMPESAKQRLRESATRNYAVIIEAFENIANHFKSSISDIK